MSQPNASIRISADPPYLARRTAGDRGETWELRIDPQRGAKGFATALAWLLIRRSTAAVGAGAAEQVDLVGSGEPRYPPEQVEDGTRDVVEALVEKELARHLRRFGDVLARLQFGQSVTTSERELRLPSPDMVARFLGP